jgi:hypothetical protein
MAKFTRFQATCYYLHLLIKSSFSFNNVKYDLYKFAEGKFSTVDSDIRLIKKR